MGVPENKRSRIRGRSEQRLNVQWRSCEKSVLIRATEELRWMEAAFQVYQENLLENGVWFRRCMTALFHLTPAMSPSGRNCAFQSKDWRPNLSSTRGDCSEEKCNTRQITHEARSPPMITRHLRESCCCQQDLQSTTNLRLSVYTDQGQGKREGDRSDDKKRALRLDSASDSNWIGGPTKTRTTRKLSPGAWVRLKGAEAEYYALCLTRVSQCSGMPELLDVIQHFWSNSEADCVLSDMAHNTFVGFQLPFGVQLRKCSSSVFQT